MYFGLSFLMEKVEMDKLPNVMTYEFLKAPRCSK